MKKIVTEFIADETNYEDGGMCQILSFDMPKNSGLSHGQFVSHNPVDVDQDIEHPVMDSLKGKKVRVTLEVIE